MQMRPSVQLASVIKAMTDVVLPAVDPANKLAQEQGRLIVGMLQLMARQIPLQYRFDCDELARLLEWSREMSRDAGGAPALKATVDRLRAATDAAAGTLERARSGPDAIEATVKSLRTAIGEVITAAYAGAPPDVLDAIEKTTLRISKEQLLRDRSWLATQGWEPDPAALPPIESLLA